MYLSNKYEQQTDEDNSGDLTGSRFERVRDIYRLALCNLRDALNVNQK